jgi:hypothetical protein
VSDTKALGGANDTDLRRSESGLVVAEEEEARRPGERRPEQGLVANVGLKPDDVPRRRALLQSLSTPRVAMDAFDSRRTSSDPSVPVLPVTVMSIWPEE